MTAALPPAVAGLTREQVELLRCLRDDMLAVATTPELAAACAAGWLELRNDAPDQAVVQEQNRWVERASTLHWLDDLDGES